MKNEETIIEIVQGVEGPSVYINNFRIAGAKPWGGGKLIYTFKSDLNLILKALDLKRRNNVKEH